MKQYLIMQTLQEFNDSDILQMEIEEYKIITKGKLEPLLLRCADKLAKSGNYEDKTVIASRLAKLFPAQKRMIQLVLPKDYKREYTKSEEVIPKTELEEYLELHEENFRNLADIIKDVRRKITSDKYQGLSEEVLKSLTSTRKLSELLEDVKSLNADLSVIKSLEDAREKIHPFQSLSLRAMLFVESLHDVAKQIDQSSKWQKIGITPKSEELIKEISNKKSLDHCITCDWNSADWFNKNLEREREGLEIIPPSIDEIKAGFKDSHIVEEVSRVTGKPKDEVILILSKYFDENKKKLQKKFCN